MFLGSLPALTYGAVECIEKEPSDKLPFLAANRFLELFFTPMQLGKIFYVNLHISKLTWQHLKQRHGKQKLS